MAGDDNEWLRTLGSVGSVGFLVAACIGIGMLAGMWLDRAVGTSPWFAFTGSLLGLAAGLVEAMRIITRVR